MSDQAIDQTRDISGRETHRLLSLYPAPEFVKSADHRTRCGDAETMPRHMYADLRNKLYPCHSSAATWLSAAFFADKSANDKSAETAAIKDNITKAAVYFGISSLVKEVFEKAAANSDSDINKLSDDDFAIVWTGDNGAKERHWPLRNATEVKFAAEHFCKYRDDFTFADRHKIANRILDKAFEYAADTSEAGGALELAAGKGECSAKFAAEMVQNRATLLRRSHPQYSAELSKLAELINSNPTESRSMQFRVKLAGVIDAVDRDTHLNRLYNAGGLPRAEEVLFVVTEKVANDFLAAHVQTTTGNVYDLAALEKLAVDDVRDYMGDEFADAVSAGGVYMDRAKLAAIVPTLDRGMAAMLDQLLQEKKVAAVVKTAAAVPLMAPEKLAELAAMAD